MILQVPRTSEVYVHRSGRTARAASEGLSLLLIGPGDVMNFKRIYKTLAKSEELPFFPVEIKYMTAIKVKMVFFQLSALIQLQCCSQYLETSGKMLMLTLVNWEPWSENSIQALGCSSTIQQESLLFSC